METTQNTAMTMEQTVEYFRGMDTEFVRNMKESSMKAAEEGRGTDFVYVTGRAAAQVLGEREKGEWL